MRDQQTWFINIDPYVIGLYIFLIVVGWINVYAVTYSGETAVSMSAFLQSPIGRQTIWIGISALVFGIIVLFLDWRFWPSSAYIVYALSILLLFSVLFLGTEIKGAKSWFIFGGMSFQPSEVAKFGVCLAMAAFLSNWRNRLDIFMNQVIAFALFLVPIGLILLQPDAGSALVFMGMLIVMYREGMPSGIYILGIFTFILLLLGILVAPLYLIASLFLFAYFMYLLNNDRKPLWILGGVILIVASIYLMQQQLWTPLIIGLGVVFLLVSIYQYAKAHTRMIGLMSVMVIYGSILAFAANYAFNDVLKPHQQERINVWLKPKNADASGAAYNVMNSKYAIASGGLEGKGWGKGNITHGRFVPEQSTDFIFCTVGEEHGFYGSAVLIFLFLGLLLRLIIIAERQRFAFARIYTYGVASILFLHVFVNIGMTMGIMPVIGIPLPFISKGGSSLLGFTIMLAVVLKMDKHRKQRVKIRHFGVG